MNSSVITKVYVNRAVVSVILRERFSRHVEDILMGFAYNKNSKIQTRNKVSKE